MELLEHLALEGKAFRKPLVVCALHLDIVVRPGLEDYDVGLVGIEGFLGILHEQPVRAAAEAMVLHLELGEVVVELRPQREVAHPVEHDLVLPHVRIVALADPIDIRAIVPAHPFLSCSAS
ncbi:MAG: hypothetical protein ACI361_02160 [Atopobiaceae bacterium]